MSNITSIISASTMARRPRAPVFMSMARRAMASIAAGVNSSSTLSSLNEAWYCLRMALRGSLTMRRSASASSSSSATTIGRRPTNSGMRPYLMRSSGCSWA